MPTQTSRWSSRPSTRGRHGSVIEQAGQRYPGVRAIELLAPGLRVPEVAERGPSLDEVRAVVEQYARVLRDHGRPLLEGEPGFFAWLRAAAATDGG